MDRALSRFRSLWVGAALVFAGCGKQADDKAAKRGPVGHECDRLGLRSSEQSMARTPPGTSDAHRELLHAASAEAGLAIARHCKVDGWSAEAIACGLAAEDPGKECGSKLTADQRKKMVDEVGPIFERVMAAMHGN